MPVVVEAGVNIKVPAVRHDMDSATCEVGVGDQALDPVSSSRKPRKA